MLVGFGRGLIDFDLVSSLVVSVCVFVLLIFSCCGQLSFGVVWFLSFLTKLCCV